MGLKRMVFANSAIHSTAPIMPMRETAPPNPLSPYAVTKMLADEHYCKVLEVCGLETVSLRCHFNVLRLGHGPSSDCAVQFRSSSILSRLAGATCIYGHGKQSRDLIFLEDIVRANILVCEAPKGAGKALNIAIGKGTSLNRLLDTLRKVGREFAPIYADTRPGI